MLIAFCGAATLLGCASPEWSVSAEDLRAMAMTSHKEGQSSKELWAYADAAELYGVYRERFGTTSAGDVLFFEGEALYVLRRWTEARDAYRRYVAASPEGQYHSWAAQAVVHAQREALGLDLRGRRSEQLAPFELSEADESDWRPAMLSVFDEYLRADPACPEFAEVVSEQRSLITRAMESGP